MDGRRSRAALAKVYGEDALSRTIGCQFHFKQSVNRHANKLTSDKSKAILKKLADNLMQSATLSLYNKCLRKVKDFISEKPHKRSFLTTWLNWWDQRRFRAFRPTDNAPTTNLAESVHSVWKTTRATNITLVDAAYHDIVESIHIERQLEQYKSGLYRGGTGPSAYSRQEQNYHSQMRRADQYASDVLKLHTGQPDDVDGTDTMYPLDPNCSHRPTRPTKRKSDLKRKQIKKIRISSHLQDTEIEQLSSSSSEVPSPPSSQQKVKRSARYRGQRSKAFEFSLERAKNMKNVLRLTQVLDLGEEIIFSVTRPIYTHEDEAPTYHVKIGKDPSCSCPYSQKSTTICKHMLWVMLFKLHIAEDS